MFILTNYLFFHRKGTKYSVLIPLKNFLLAIFHKIIYFCIKFNYIWQPLNHLEEYVLLKNM